MAHSVSLLLLFPAIALCFMQSPKIFINIETIESIYPLKHGFEVVFPEKLLKTQLHGDNNPVVYVSAVPLEDGLAPFTQFFYKLSTNRITVSQLDEKSWYYVCVEFENTHQFERRGNFSTSCQLRRTLDKFGKSASTMASELAVLKIAPDFISVKAEIDVRFPIRLETYLENAPLLQSYVVRHPQTLKIEFNKLIPSYDYGRLCIREVPLVPRYTSMGRSIHETLGNCYFDKLRTLERSMADSGTVSVVQKEFYQSTPEKASGIERKKVDFLVLLLCFMWFVF